MERNQHQSKTRLLDSTLAVVRGKGYAATTIDDICAQAGVTKGSFFHHFKGKEDLALAAVTHWNEVTGAVFRSAPYQRLADPRDRVLGYIDFRATILDREVAEFTCLLGTLVQETYQTHPALRSACEAGISGHAAELAKDLALAKAKYAADAGWDPQGVALFTQAALQGAFILAKAKQGPKVVAECIAHLRRYLELILNMPPARTVENTRGKPASKEKRK